MGIELQNANCYYSTLFESPHSKFSDIQVRLLSTWIWLLSSGKNFLSYSELQLFIISVFQSGFLTPQLNEVIMRNGDFQENTNFFS